jgi:hypothetical protein
MHTPICIPVAGSTESMGLIAFGSIPKQGLCQLKRGRLRKAVCYGGSLAIQPYCGVIDSTFAAPEIGIKPKI